MLKVKDLHKSYKNFEVLKGVDFSVNKGEIKALIGVNGSGKSTLIECICGVKKFDSGSVNINDIDINDKKQKTSYKKSIGYMPQHFGLFHDLTVRENLEYMCAVYGIDKACVDEILTLCNLKDYEKKLAGNLSGGYKQLLSCACAIIHKPKLIILDEPSSAMDPIFRKRFWGILNTTKEWGCTILIITHFLEELLNCDAFACLNKGKVCYEGDVKDFIKDGFVDINQILEKYTGN